MGCLGWCLKTGARHKMFISAENPTETQGLENELSVVVPFFACNKPSAGVDSPA